MCLKTSVKLYYYKYISGFLKQRLGLDWIDYPGGSIKYVISMAIQLLTVQEWALLSVEASDPQPLGGSAEQWWGPVVHHLWKI